ncbi:MAG: amidohydrolase family protein [Pseudomonadota bacterium]|nr:amidohydrolase family protein [Pseudomonadota bacterium]
MTQFEGQFFDADNHYYESHDAFTRHVPKGMQSRCVQWVTMENGRKYHSIAGKIDRFTNPTFDPISKPGVLRELFRGNPNGATSNELIRSSLEPMPPEYMNREARLAKLDEQGLEAIWLFPTLAILYEELLKNDVEALCTTYTAFNQWLDEDWGFNYENRLFAAPYISLADVEWACDELEKALARDARVLVMRPSAVYTRRGPRNPAATEFDPFWSRVNEAGITVVAHIGATRHDSNGYDVKNQDVLSMGPKPSVTNFHRARNINDFLASLLFDRLFERYPNLRIASVENGSEFLGDLLKALAHSKERTPTFYTDDPVDSFKEHVWVNPFWEDDISEIIDFMGEDHVIVGSDWPHMEGLKHPRDIFDEIENIPLSVQTKILRDNTAALNQRLGAKA